MKTKLLLLLLLANFSIYAQTNLVPNGNFETWTSSSQPDNWYRYLNGIASQSSVAQNGASSTNMTISNGTLTFINSELFPVVSGKTYRVTLYHKLVKGTLTSIDFSLQHKPSTFKEVMIKKSDVTFSTTEWKKIEFDYTPTVSENIEVDVWINGNTNAEILVDNVSVVDINEPVLKYTLIPDINFENKLIALGIDSGVNDGQVLTSKISNLTYLNVSNSSIADLTGIQDFASLKDLNCGYNALKTLDITKNTALTTLNSNSNQLSTVNISKNVNLTFLNLSANQLTDIDVTNNTALTTVAVGTNKLSSINLSKNIAATYIGVNENLFTSLDFSQNTKVTELYCGVNQLTSLDFSNNTALKYLSCAKNKLTSLNLSKNVLLENLKCEENKLTSLDLSSNVLLNYLICTDNALTSLNVSNNPLITFLWCQRNQLTSIDITSVTALQTFNCYSNLIETLNVSKNTKIQSIGADQNKLKELDVTANPLLQGLTIYKNPEISAIDVSKNPLLKSLACSSTNIASLDLASNPALTSLDASYTKITNLDLSKNTNLSLLYCYNNDNLKSINLKNGNNSKLTGSNSIFRNNFKLNCIDVDDVDYANANWSTFKDASRIYSTDCASVVYTKIPDVNFEKKLINLGIDSGATDGQVMTANISKLKTLVLSESNIKDFTGIQDFSLLEELSVTNNNSTATIVTMMDLSKNQSLKKLDLTYAGITSLDVSNNLALTELYCYGNKLTSLNVSKNLALKKLDCSYNRITSLDVTNNLNLTHLTCSASNVEGEYTIKQGLLTSLDLSKNIALEYLDCSWNDKIVLDVSKNINLTSINVGHNKLTAVDFSANKLLKSLRCDTNEITTIDLSKYPYLESIDCSYNKITVLDVSQKPALKRILCAYNQLSSLDVSKNPLLETIYCNSNNITSLDLSANPNLKQILCGSNKNLTKLNLKNGNNTKLDKNVYSSFSDNPNLSCITVDDVEYANKNWATYKDAIASYNIECGFSLPSKNFNIEVKGESCANESNGEITITASAPFPYVATISGKTYSFTDKVLNVNKLTPGSYTIVITVPGEVYEQTFSLIIPKASTIAGKSTIASKKVEVEITAGTAPYTVFVDGEAQFQTTNANFTLELEKTSLVEVATSKACEGIFSKKVSSSELGALLSAYPNPTTGSFEIEIPVSKNEVKIEIYNFGGQLVSAKNYTIENGKAQLNLENNPSGIYAAKIYLDTPEYIKIIKK